MQVRDLFVSPHPLNEEVQAFLSEYGIKKPLEADLHLQHIAESLEFRDGFTDFVSALLEQAAASADPDAALLHLRAFFEVVPSFGNLVSYLQEHPKALEVLCKILGASPFLTQLLIRSPEYFYWLMEAKRLNQIQGRIYFSREADTCTLPFHDSKRVLDALRRLRRREMLRIAAQDILGIGGFEGTVSQISALADAVLQKTFDLLWRELGPSGTFAVLALGKLGGSELNFSSDVDLLYIYGEDQDQAASLKFAREYTRALTDYSNEGHLYRVDLRLRPMGKTGESAYSLEACRQYYENWADTFDRLALIKCRFVAGDRELGRRFVESIQDFIFKKYLDTAAVEEIRWLKRRTNSFLRRREENERNIKLGFGGIREIEFFVQAFQLLYGGRHSEIRNPNTLAALDRLVDCGFVRLDDYTMLRRAYIYLRDLEHKLQLVHDRQTHLLPEDDAEMVRCARRMGYRGDAARDGVLNAFTAELNRHTEAVRKIYDSLFEEGPKPATFEELILNPELGPEKAIGWLEQHGVSNAGEVYEGLKILDNATAFPHSPSRLRNLLANLAPQLISAAQWTRPPRSFFSRFDRFSETLGSRAPLYSELIENREFCHKLLKILSTGEFLSETLIRNPELVDVISPNHREGRALGQLPATYTRNALRVYKQREEFKIAVEDLFHDSSTTRGRLTRLAEICIDYAFRQVLGQLPEIQKHRFTLLALGKLGGRELTYHSDLDVVLVYDDAASPGPQIFESFLKELHDELELYTESGTAYHLDFRLRPEGKHGAPATPRRGIEKYFAGRAEPWERLAYVKVRPLIWNGAEISLDHVVFSKTFSESELQELQHIRQRKEFELGQEEELRSYNFKVGRGGLMDIQFVVQYLQIQHGIREPNTLHAIERVAEAGHLDQESARDLRRGLEFLFRVEKTQRLLEEKPVSSFSQSAAEGRILAHFLGYQSGEDLLKHYLAQTRRIRAIYNQVLLGSPPAHVGSHD